MAKKWLEIVCSNAGNVKLEADLEGRILKGVSILTKGYVPSHDIEFGDEALDDVVKLGNTAKPKIKSRFSHPRFSDDGLGKFMGRAQDFRRDGDHVRADFHLAKAAFKSPFGDFGTYILELADEDPDAFGISIVAQIEEEPFDDHKDKKRKRPMSRVLSLRAADFVDDPAANDSLFNNDDRRDTVMSDENKDPKAGQNDGTPVVPPGEARELVTQQLSNDDLKQVKDAVSDLASFREEMQTLTSDLKAGKVQLSIRKECTKYGMDDDFTAKVLDSEGVTLEGARKAILDNMAENQTNLHVSVGKSGNDKHFEAMKSAFTYRALDGSGLERKTIDKYELVEGAEDFKYASIYDMAKEWVEISLADNPRVNIRQLTKEQIAATALGFGKQFGVQLSAHGGEPGWHTTGSFPLILQDAMDKTLRAGYDEREMTFRTVFRQGQSKDDFKTIHRVQIGDIGNVDVWPGNEPMKMDTINESEEFYAVESYGKEVSFSWRSLVNDDMSAFSVVPAEMGKAMIRTLNAICWARITGNFNLSDGQPLFSAVAGDRLRTNIGTDAVINKTSLGEGREIMRLQVGLNKRGATATASQAILNVVSRFLVVPAVLETAAAEQILSIFDPTDNRNQTANQFRGLELIVEPLLDADSQTAWYLFSDMIPHVEYTFLTGHETPVTRQREDFDTWSLKYQMVQTVAAKDLDFRGAFRNAGV